MPEATAVFDIVTRPLAIRVITYHATPVGELGLRAQACGCGAAGGKMVDVADFVGDACSAMASRIRGAVAGEPFDTFHRNSSAIIQAAVFGVNKETGKPRDKLEFKNNLLVVTSVDIQSVEPVDSKTREASVCSVWGGGRIQNWVHQPRLTLEEREGGGVWVPKVCVPKMARSDFPNGKLRSFPAVVTSVRGGGGCPPMVVGRSNVDCITPAVLEYPEQDTAHKMSQLHEGATPLANPRRLVRGPAPVLPPEEEEEGGPQTPPPRPPRRNRSSSYGSCPWGGGGQGRLP